MIERIQAVAYCHDDSAARPVPVPVVRAYWSLFRSDLDRLNWGYPLTRRAIVFLMATEPGALAAFFVRLLCALHARGYSVPARVVRQIGCIVTGAEVSPGCEIGPGLVLRHPSGVVIGGKAILGARCTIMQGVTIGTAHVDSADDTYPVLGDDVVLGAGSVLLGAIRIGDSVEVGAGAVVTRDVPPHHLAVGVPARAFPRTAVQP